MPDVSANYVGFTRSIGHKTGVSLTEKDDPEQTFVASTLLANSVP